MFTGVSGSRKIQYFSNPNVEYRWGKTGVEGSKENWLRLKNSACTVASFRQQVTPVLQARIGGVGFGCPCDNIGIGAIVSGGIPGPYFLAWQKSNDGFNWSGVQSISSSYSFQLPCEEGEGIYVRLTVTSADSSETVQSFRFFEAATTWPGQEQICFEREANDKLSYLDRLAIQPNPNNGTFHISTELYQGNGISIEIFDNLGRVVHSLAEMAIPGRYEREIKLPHLYNGIYTVKVLANGKTVARKVVIN
jgi:hypothetical protein